VSDQSQRENDEVAEEVSASPIVDARTVALVGIFVILLIHFFHFAAPVLIPVTLAFLLSTMLSPLQRQLVRWHVPAALSASLIVVVLTGGFLGTVYGLAGPAQEWLQRVPTSFDRLEANLSALKEPIQELKDATDKLEKAARLESEDNGVAEVRVQNQAVSDRVLDGTTQLAISAGVVLVLVLFFLLNTDSFLRKLVGMVPNLSDKKLTVEIVRSIQEDISIYLFALTIINVALGVIMGIVAALIGLPNPMLWGGLVALLSFAPYAGTTLAAVILTIIGLMTFDGLLWALIAPGIFLVLMFIYGNFMIPLVLGNRLSLSAVAIFLAIVFWGWLWGVAGALLAVPILASFKIICDRFVSLKPIADFLSP